VKNFGVSQYSPIMYLLQWDTIEGSFNPSHVFVQLYSNDTSEDERYYAMAVKDDNGHLIAVPGPGTDWIRVQLRKSYLVRFVRKLQLQLKWMYENSKADGINIVSGIVEENPSITELSASLVKKLKNKVTLSGSNFTLLVVPSKYRSVTGKYDHNVMEFSDKWKHFSDENEIEFVDLTKEFKRESLNGVKLFFDKDIHFNENGHTTVANVIVKRYHQLFK